VDAIELLLAGMGDTPEGVAEVIRGRGVRGLPDSPSLLNPLVRYLNRALAVGSRMEVGARGTVLRLQLAGKVREVALPPAVQAFLAAFNEGRFPDLEQR
jgi:hypothetical protein